MNNPFDTLLGAPQPRVQGNPFDTLLGAPPRSAFAGAQGAGALYPQMHVAPFFGARGSASGSYPSPMNPAAMDPDLNEQPMDIARSNFVRGTYNLPVNDPRRVAARQLDQADIAEQMKPVDAIDNAAQWVNENLLTPNYRGAFKVAGPPSPFQGPPAPDHSLEEYQKSSLHQVGASIQRGIQGFVNPLEWASFGAHAATDPLQTVSGIGQQLSKIFDPNATAGERTDGLITAAMLLTMLHGGIEGVRGHLESMGVKPEEAASAAAEAQTRLGGSGAPHPLPPAEEPLPLPEAVPQAPHIPQVVDFGERPEATPEQLAKNEFFNRPVPAAEQLAKNPFEKHSPSAASEPPLLFSPASEGEAIPAVRSPGAERVPIPEAEAATSTRSNAPTRAEFPGEKPSPDWSTRVVRRPDGEYKFSDPEEASMYDAVLRQSQRITADLSRQLKNATDPQEQMNIRGQLDAERRNLQEDQNAFFSEKRLRDRVRSGIDPDLDEEFRRAVARDDVAPGRPAAAGLPEAAREAPAPLEDNGAAGEALSREPAASGGVPDNPFGEPATATKTLPTDAEIADIRARLSKQKQAGFTRLPFGDLKQMVSDLGDLAHVAISKGKEFADWSADMVRQFGKRTRDFVAAAWERGKKLFAEGDAERGERPSVSDLKTAYKAGEMTPDAYRGELWKRFGGRLNMGLPAENFEAALSLAVHHFEKTGDRFSAWRKEMVRDFGPEIKPRLKNLYDLARREADEAGPPVDESGAHGRAAPKPGKTHGLLTAKDKLEKLFLTDKVPAKVARRALEASSGRDLAGSKYDLEEALNRVGRSDKKIEWIVSHGFTSPDGEKLSMGLTEMHKEMEQKGFNYDDWQTYRRLKRENVVAQRPGSTLDARRVLANKAFVDKYLAATDPDLVKHFDGEFDKFADQHLKLYEKYGLREKGWADRIRAENPDYFPLHRAPLEVNRRMAELNPIRVASPDSAVHRATGGARYMDAFNAMARETERVVRNGEETQNIRPFLKAAASQPDMAHIVKEITEEKSKKFREMAGRAVERQIAGGADPFEAFASELDQQPREGETSEMMVRDEGMPRWYRLDPDVWNTIRGEQPQAIHLASQVMQAIAGVNRAGTTSHNPFFTLITAPGLHATSGLTMFGANPLRIRETLPDILRAEFGGKHSEAYAEAIDSNALMRHISANDYLEQKWLYDPERRGRIEKIADQLADNAGVKVLKWTDQNLVKLGDAIQQAQRLAFFQQMKESYLKKGLPEDEARMRASADAANMMNYNEAGDWGKLFARGGVPFANVKSQVLMAAARGLRGKQFGGAAAGAARIGGLITAMKLAEYFTHRDDDEYRRLPDYVKDGSYVVKIGGQFYALRFPEELGVLFAGIPRRIMETVDDPEAKGMQKFKDGMVAAAKAYKPAMMPTAAAAGGQAGLYMGAGMAVDLRFDNLSLGTPYSGKEGYKFTVQEIDTLLGGLGRLGARTAGYFLGEEKKLPNPLQRLAPEPIEPRAKKGRALVRLGLNTKP